MAEPVSGRVTCEQATALLVDYVTGELDPVTMQVMEWHLARCSDCTAFLCTYRETIRMTRMVRYEALPDELQHRLLQTLQTKITGAPPP
jgi:predicted anti-sigma-YlaC factor YlaD